MSSYDFDLIGVDFKPRRKGTRIRKNRFKPTYSRWLLPTILFLVSLGFIVVGMR